MPRRTAEQRAAADIRDAARKEANAAQIVPPPGLMAEAHDFFEQLVREMPADHFIPSDTHLLANYATICAVFDREVAGLTMAELGDKDTTPLMVNLGKLNTVREALAKRLRVGPMARDPVGARGKQSKLRPRVGAAAGDDGEPKNPRAGLMFGDMQH